MKIILSLLILGILLISACNKNKIGNTIVEYSKESSQITIDNFPHPRFGIEGANTATYPEGFSMQKIDEVIYDLIKSKGFPIYNITVKCRFVGQDQYGKDTLGNWLDIGILDVRESKKYEDFHLWSDKFGIDEMLNQLSNEQEVSNGSNLPSNIKNDILNLPSETPAVESRQESQADEIDFTYGKGYITFHNTKEVPVKDIMLAYYVSDTNFSGWMTAGKWALEPGEKYKFPVPLNSNGTLNREMYYFCIYQDVDSLYYTISGDASFMISKNNEFVVLNAASPTLHDDSNTFFNQFRKIQLGGDYKNFTIGIGPDPDQQ